MSSKLSFVFLFLFFLPFYFLHAASINNWKVNFNHQQQIIIYKNIKLINFSIIIESNQLPLIQIIINQKTKKMINQTGLLLKLNHSLYHLHKSNKSNLQIFEISLPSLQSRDFFNNFSSQENAYISFNQEIIPLPLKGTSIIYNQILDYIYKKNMKNTGLFPINKFNHHLSKNIRIKSLMLLSMIICIIIIFLLNVKIHKLIKNSYKNIIFYFQRKKALHLGYKEIQSQFKILALKKDQLCYKDDYGTLIEDKWIKEIHRFIKVRILPILSNHHLKEILPYIENKFIKKIQKNSCKKYIRQISTKQINDFTPFEYETYCANLLQQIGWQTKVTVASGDQGADVIAFKNNKKLILQCKLYKKPVGNKAVQEIFAAKEYYHAQYAAVVSNAPYTTSARQLANSVRITLLHHNFLQDYANHCD